MTPPINHDRTTTTKQQTTLLSESLIIADKPTIHSILSQSPTLATQPIQWTDSDSQQLTTPPIFIAVDYGHVDLVKELLPYYEKNMDVESKEEGGYTVLQWASWVGGLEIVKLLVEGGATADEEALSLAREHNHTAVAEYLLQHINLYSDLSNDDLDAIMDKACREGDAAKVRQLLKMIITILTSGRMRVGGIWL
eukprot:g11442.t1 g11442   contig5:867359-868112(+)